MGRDTRNSSMDKGRTTRNNPMDKSRDTRDSTMDLDCPMDLGADDRDSRGHG